jgi:hypothetical protein
MRVLLLSPLYYPSQSPNIYRWDAIARHWIAQGHEVHWLCTRLVGEPSAARRNGIFIYRTGHHTLLDWCYDLLRIRAKRRGTLGSGLPRKSLFRQYLESMVHLTWRKLYWSDGACLWYFPAKRKALQLMQDQHFDAIISVSLPFTAVRIAKAVKEKHPDIRWLMDIEDPFSFVSEYFINNRALYKSLNIKAEGKALRHADIVSVTVEAAKQKYLECFPFLEGKITVTPPLFEEQSREGKLPAMFSAEPEKIHLGYFGTFYHPIRSPQGLLNLLLAVKKQHPALAEKLVVHLVGSIPVEYADAFSAEPSIVEHLRFYGLVSRETVAAMMERMDFLLNIGNSTDYHLPSKSAEYLMSGKPIINIARIETDSFNAFMKDYPLLLNLFLPEDQPDSGQIEAFVEFLEAGKGMQVEMKKRKESGAPYLVEAIAANFLKCLA